MEVVEDKTEQDEETLKEKRELVDVVKRLPAMKTASKTGQ